MGVRNTRAICPNCGGKIHTQPKGLGHFSLWANSWFLVQTGDECQHCGVALTGRVKYDNRAELAMQVQPPVPDLPPDQAWCVLCGGLIYRGDTVCPNGHALRANWEGELHQQIGMWPKEQPAEPPQRQVSESRLDDLERLAKLRESGTLTDDEFQAEKARLMQQSSSPTEDGAS